MARTKADYYEMGKQCAVGNAGPSSVPREGTWQHAAWKSGFDDGCRLNARGVKSTDGWPVSEVPEMTLGWPRAAGEHMLALAIEHKREMDAARRARLRKAMARMLKRHKAKGDANVERIRAELASGDFDERAAQAR